MMSTKKKGQKNYGSGQKKIWACNHGCENKTQPCVHLNKLIQTESGESVKAVPTGKIDKFYYESGAGYVIPKEIRDRTWELQFRTKLMDAGLEQIKIDILVLRFIYEMTIKDIGEELGFLSSSSTLRFLNESLAHLKKIGFSKK